MLSVKCYLKAKRKKNLKKQFVNKNLAGFFTFYFALCFILVYSNIVKTYETLLTYDLHIRNTDPRFHLVSFKKKHFRSQMKNVVSFKRVLTVSSNTLCYLI